MQLAVVCLPHKSGGVGRLDVGPRWRYLVDMALSETKTAIKVYVRKDRLDALADFRKAVGVTSDAALFRVAAEMLAREMGMTLDLDEGDRLAVKATMARRRSAR